MDLGLTDRKAIVCASSRGLGKACAVALAREGVHVVVNGRSAETLDRAAFEISSGAKGSVTPVVADLNTEEGRAKLLAACPDADILVNNNDGPPPGNFAQWGEAEWRAALDANMLAPLFMIKGLMEGMKERRFGRIVNITSAMVKAPRAVMGLSTAARSGLTAMCKGLSTDLAPFNVTINNMLPERFDTDRQKKMAELAMAFKKITMEEARAEIESSIAAKRMGDPSEFGDACAFLCSAQAGFITGQNLQLDGGTYPGLI
ncbi:SDR family oxidoreductase [Parvibaculum sp.]|jgi:3-oxoacyl-[acyl-carrier protein] reductase|uniref:SDR family oxidoreductase n=1 Tax=Parvibaculum sp. TaxID=2024848 RepID=UPI002FDB8133